MAKRNVYRAPVVQPLDPSYKLIPLTQHQVAAVSTSKYEFLMQWNWFVIPSTKTKTCYAGRMQRLANGRNHLILMHRVVMGTTQDVDHKNGDGLDNRDDNLRPCTDTQNAGNQRLAKNNTSGYKGVSWHKPTQKWIVHIYERGRQIHLGLFSGKLNAARAYNEAAEKLFGEFAQLNHLEPSHVEQASDSGVPVL